MVDATLERLSPISQFNVIQSIDYPTLVTMGLIPNHVHGHQFGENTIIPSSAFIILSNVTSVTFPNNFPTIPQQMQVVSTSVNDSSLGNGGQQALLTYLRSPSSPQGYTLNTEYITMNGLVPVLTLNNDIFRIESFELSKVGSTGSAAGNISLQSVGGATTFERIDATRRINKTCVHFVPKGYRSLLFGITKGSSTIGGTHFVLRASKQYQGNNIVNHSVDELEMGNFSIHTNLVPPEMIQNPDGLDMYFVVVVQGHASNQSASGSIHFIDSPI